MTARTASPSPPGPKRAGSARRSRLRGGWLRWTKAWALAAALAGAGAASASDGRPAGPVAGARLESVALDFPRGTGAALLRRGDTVLAVFDSPDLRNPEALRHPALAGAVQVRTLPQALVLAVPGRLAPAIGLARGPSGWVLVPSRDAAASEGSRAEAALSAGPAPSVAIGGVPPNRVVVLRDPESDLPLLVGTTREAGRGSAGGRRTPEYDLLPTALGVAVLARSESLRLQAERDRFLLSGSALSPLPLDAASVGPEGGAAMTRCLGLPDLPLGQLLVRLRSLGARIAAAEPLARAAPRREMAATMLALGLAHEAQAEMSRAFTEDAGAADAPGARALAAAAALLAGRTDEAAAALRAAAAPGCDEAALWRSLFLARTGDAAGALPGLQAALPLLRSYPAALRDRLAPIVAEAFAEAGAWLALRAMLADDASKARLPLPAAMLAEADGNADGALTAYDAIAAGRDRRARAVALRRAVELRLRTGRMDHAAAARAYDAALFAWRGDAVEREARTRLAQLLALSGDAGAAVALLRQTAALFPDHASSVRREAGRVLRAAMDDAGSPLAAVAAFQGGSDLLPPEEREASEARLVDLLLALDLPARAAALLDGAAARAPAGEARAEIGLHLAALRLRENDAEGARAALDGTDAPDLAEGLRARRAELASAAAGRRGGTSARPVMETPEAALGRRDWGAAAQALRTRLDVRLPAAPAPLDRDGREAVLRLAAALTLAGDDAALLALRERFADRMGEGPHAEAFARLAAAPRPGAMAAAAAAKPVPAR